jgi:CRP-like cAMP-binding protein
MIQACFLLRFAHRPSQKDHGMENQHDSPVALMRQIAFLASLSDSDIAKLARLASVLQLEAGTVLFREGELCNQMFLVSTGSVALEMCLPRRGCTRMITVGPGEIVGLSTLLGGGAMTAVAIVVEDATLISLPAKELGELCQEDHDIGYTLMKTISQALLRRLIGTRLQMLDVFGETQPTPAAMKSSASSRTQAD